jgi:hypothetical protein
MNTIIIKENTFKSIKDACEYFNIKYSTVNSRLHRGWSIEEAFGLVKRNNNCKHITVDGKTFKSIKEACDYYNVDYRTLRSRLKRWSLEEAFEIVPRTKEIKGKEILLDGKTFISIAEGCRYYNINYNTVRHRMSAYGWTPEEAFELVPRKK